jgi:hypothetical protein
MPDPDPQEIAAMEHASDMAGEYLESLPSTDLAAFTPDAWQTLIEVICGAYVEKLNELADGAAARHE